MRAIRNLSYFSLNRSADPSSVGLGLTIRGGVEHGLGHFVSAVEQGSEAHVQVRNLIKLFSLIFGK